jgi:Na+-transporting NADH:ubiquinone oxidoreductase subunit F
MAFPQAQDHSININNGAKTVAVRHGASLLTGLAQKGILVPSACGGRARCGACKIKVIGGGAGLGQVTSIPTPPELPLLSAEEQAQGYRLSCQVTVESDISVEMPEEVFSIKQFTGKLIAKRPLTYDILHLHIELVKPETIDFSAGQYVQIRSQPYQGKSAVIRAFSIASAPSHKNRVELMIRRIPYGICTEWIFDHLKEGDKVYFTAPYGRFRLSGSTLPILFIAGGSGMGPIWSMLNDMKEKGIRRRATYFFGALTQRDLFLTDELTALQKELPGFSFVPALSNEPEGGDWKGQRGLITDVVARHYHNCAGHEAYLCGSPGMIEASRKVLVKCGTPEENIFYDKFV